MRRTQVGINLMHSCLVIICPVAINLVGISLENSNLVYCKVASNKLISRSLGKR